MRFRRSFSRGRRRRPMHWAVPNIGWDGLGQQAFSANTSFTYQLGGAIREAQTLSTTGFLVERATILRIRGTWSMTTTDHTAIGDIITYVAMLYKLAAGQGGAATTLNPSVQGDVASQDVLWTTSGFVGITPLQTGSANAIAGMVNFSAVKCEIDIKAKRVMRPGDQLQFAVISSAAGQSLLNIRYLLAGLG